MAGVERPLSVFSGSSARGPRPAGTGRQPPFARRSQCDLNRLWYATGLRFVTAVETYQAAARIGALQEVGPVHLFRAVSDDHSKPDKRASSDAVTMPVWRTRPMIHVG